MSGVGDTHDEAEEDLRTNFEHRVTSGDKLPRPGGQNPTIKFASTDELDRNSELLQPFISDVLQLPWAWISDESSLWDFHTEIDNASYYERIENIYGVDVSDIEGARIHDILDAHRQDKIGFWQHNVVFYNLSSTFGADSLSVYGAQVASMD